jgi:hypothetical protein
VQSDAVFELILDLLLVLRLLLRLLQLQTKQLQM